MKSYNIYSVIMISMLFAIGGFAQNVLAKDTSKESGRNITQNKVIIQVSENDPKKWNLALNNAKNVQEDFGKNNVDVEIIAYGPGLPMLKLESEAGSRIADALNSGVKVVACENTMNIQKLTKADMLPNLAYVKSGVPYLMIKQQQGYAYIRP